MGRVFLALLGLAATLPGCSTDPNADILLGKWGGRGLGISASPASVTVNLPCRNRGTLLEAVPLGPDGNFAFETTVRDFYGSYEVYVSGRVTGRFLEVGISNGFSRPPDEPHLLVSGVDPDFSGYVCLAEPQ